MWALFYEQAHKNMLRKIRETDYKLRHWDQIVAKEAAEKERIKKFSEELQAEKKQKSETVADKNDIDRLLAAIAKKHEARVVMQGQQLSSLATKFSTFQAQWQAFLTKFDEDFRRVDGTAKYAYAICKKVEESRRIPGIVPRDGGTRAAYANSFAITDVAGAASAQTPNPDGGGDDPIRDAADLPAE